MTDLQTDVSQLTFSSLCSRIEQKEGIVIEFELKYRFHNSKHSEVFSIQALDDVRIVSDMGCTLANLSDIFELSEPDVSKNIKVVLSQFEIIDDDGAFIYKFDATKSIIPQLLHYLSGIHFLYTMKIFYM